MKEVAYSKVKSVARAATIIKSFIGVESWGPADLARHVGLHKSVVHRLLLTLAGSGVLVRDIPTGRYSLGPVIAQLKPNGGLNGPLKAVARLSLQRLAAATQETISLCVLEGTHCLCIDYINSAQSMRATVFGGETYPLHAGSVGKVMLSHQSEEFIESLLSKRGLKRYTPNTITDPKKLRAELAKIRLQGYGFSDSELTIGARTISAPVHDASGAAIANLAVSAPDFRLPDGNVGTVAALLRGEAAKLSRALGYVPAKGPRLARPVTKKAA